MAKGDQRKKAVTLAKKLARMRDEFTCQYCGRKEPNVRTHGSHIYAEGKNPNMSADVDNILCLCAVHHMAHASWNRSNDWSWHGTPKEAIDWFKEKYPELEKELRLRSQKVYKVDWENKYKELKDALR